MGHERDDMWQEKGDMGRGARCGGAGGGEGDKVENSRSPDVARAGVTGDPQYRVQTRKCHADTIKLHRGRSEI